MTELETQLMTALKRLSAQFEREQRQHAEERQRLSEQVEVLRRQFERLDGRMTGLAQDYETLAETLREPWR